HPHGHRLDAPSGQPAPNLAPEEGADRVADQPIEDAPRLLRVDAVHINAARVLERILDCPAGDFVELDAPDLLVAVEAKRLDEMPGDRFTLAIGVGGEQDGGLPAGVVLQSLDHVFAVLRDDILGLKFVFNVDAEPAGGQVADVPEAGTNGKA